MPIDLDENLRLFYQSRKGAAAGPQLTAKRQTHLLAEIENAHMHLTEDLD
jgi:hypothetical protein